MNRVIFIAVSLALFCFIFSNAQTNDDNVHYHELYHAAKGTDPTTEVAPVMNDYFLSLKSNTLRFYAFAKANDITSMRFRLYIAPNEHFVDATKVRQNVDLTFKGLTSTYDIYMAEFDLRSFGQSQIYYRIIVTDGTKTVQLKADNTEVSDYVNPNGQILRTVTAIAGDYEYNYTPQASSEATSEATSNAATSHSQTSQTTSATSSSQQAGQTSSTSQQAGQTSSSSQQASSSSQQASSSSQQAGHSSSSAAQQSGHENTDSTQHESTANESSESTIPISSTSSFSSQGDVDTSSSANQLSFAFLLSIPFLLNW